MKISRPAFVGRLLPTDHIQLISLVVGVTGKVRCMKNHSEPSFAFMVSAEGGPLPVDPDSLRSCVPLSRPGLQSKPDSHVTYNEYLQGIKLVISNNWTQFSETVNELASPDSGEITQIEVIAEKHGSDYHPARIRAHCGDTVVSLVVNAALTNRGKARLAREFQVLRQLHRDRGSDFIPKVYFLGKEPIKLIGGNVTDAVMFFGQWFDGFHEFHLSEGTGSSPLEMVLWDRHRGLRVLDRGTVFDIYRRAALILTYYYDTDNFSEIFPWHHAAGDFVAAVNGGSAEVRLIAARDFSPRIVFLEDTSQNRLEGLVHFLANLTVRMRLDRLDGVGDLVWADDHCLQAALRGFLDAVSLRVAEGSLDLWLAHQFLDFAAQVDPRDLAGVFGTVLESYDENAPDVPVVVEHLADHVFQVFRMLRSLSCSRGD